MYYWHNCTELGQAKFSQLLDFIAAPSRTSSHLSSEMDSHGKKIKKSKKKKHTLPSTTQLPPPIPNMNPLPMPPRPSMPTSQSYDFFKVPPPSSSLQYYSMPSHGGSASTTNNVIPTPHFPASSPRGPASQIGNSPPIESSSHHSSQHGGSSPALSTPSISNLDIGGSHAAASPSTSTSTVAGTVRHCAGGTIQYDNFHRLIIIPRNVGFLPSFQAAHMVMASMKPFFHEPWNSWKEIPYQIRMNMWQQFKEKERGGDVTYAEVFAETHKKKKKDGTREGWIEPRALETFDKYHIDLDAWKQTQLEGTQPTPEDMTAIWTQAAGGVNKGRVYGIGVQPSSSRPPTTLFTGASVSKEDMESMHQKVDQMSQELQETQALIQKLLKKKGNKRAAMESESESEEEIES